MQNRAMVFIFKPQRRNLPYCMQRQDVSKDFKEVFIDRTLAVGGGCKIDLFYSP